MINTLKDDPYFDAIYQGDKEVIVAGTIDGIKWKGKLDCLVLDRGLFLDLKTTQDLHKKNIGMLKNIPTKTLLKFTVTSYRWQFIKNW